MTTRSRRRPTSRSYDVHPEDEDSQKSFSYLNRSNHKKRVIKKDSKAEGKKQVASKRQSLKMRDQEPLICGQMRAKDQDEEVHV
jgi:hypothetical protein